MHIKIGARRSDLARIQAHTVGFAIEKRGHTVSYVFKESFGDQNLDMDLRADTRRGVFTQDFVADLEQGVCDIVVHSWKDLPTEERNSTEVVATFKREDPRDVLFVKKSAVPRIKSTRRLCALTSSPRRETQVAQWARQFLPFSVDQIDFQILRGNIPTRIDKLFANEKADALLIAKAALDRILTSEQNEFEKLRDSIRARISDCEWVILPVHVSTPAAAQGALAIEIHKSRGDLRVLLQEVNDAETFRNVTLEREKLKQLGGGCEQKIGVHVLNVGGGRLEIQRGQRSTGEEINQILFVPAQNLPATTLEKVANDKTPTPRRALSVSKEDLSEITNSFCLITRKESWPDSKISPKVIWVSGLKTWESLRQKGIWVNGTLEGLGEQFLPTFKGWFDEPANWIKLSHREATQYSRTLRTIATYELGEAEVADTTNKTHFFWMSASHFERGLRHDASIIERWHACGPGLTFEHLKKHYGAQLGDRLVAFPSREIWLEHILRSTEK